MQVCVLSGSSFERNYSSYHLMRDLIQQLLENGHEVKLIQKCFSKSNYLPPELLGKDGLAVSNIPFKQADKKNLVKRMLSDMGYYVKAAKAIYQYKNCDVFFLQSNNVPWLPIGMIKIATRKPVVYNVQDVFPQNAIFSGMLSEKSMISRVLLKLQKWALQHSSSVITISEDMKETLIEAGVSPDKVYVIYNWKNSVKDESKRIPKVDDGKFHVVYAGNIGRMQNVEVIIKAAAKITDHPEIQFDIYGNGVLKEKCMTLAQKLNATNISFLAPVPADEAYALYENADLNVIPLAKDIIKTALPSKTAVCLECGKPAVFCIGTDSRFSTLIKKRTVFTIGSNEEDELAKVILNCVENKVVHISEDETPNMFDKNISVKKYDDILLKSAKRGEKV